ncbi:hypothetical protein DE146DRAFT_46988 [Phaeosphaeria sp. MPI-PUGE-AT-0046c]|nr:hypothetical protein DE146DRAFT_46988 [Phaeosphaeria sp. MPI-PUGE-AT-0046c]
MVLSMLVAIIAAPGLLGSQEATRQSQSKEKREEHRARRCNLIATCVKSSIRSRQINGRPVVLRDGKLWIDTGTEDGAPLGHPYAGYYLPYPDSNHEGLVTTITDVAPIMNWVYIDKETHEAKYGVRVDAQPNLTGPFDCTRQDRRMTFDGWEGWCAVEESAGLWALYFDVSDDGLKSKVPPGTRVLEIELSRKEKRFQKEAGARQQDQTTKRAVDAHEDAPVDQPLAPEALVSKPGVMDAPQQTPEESPQAQQETQKPKPFRIPRSIFENPPPVLESSVFERPLTPPPAYSTTERPTSPVPGFNTTQEGISVSSTKKSEKYNGISEPPSNVTTSVNQPADSALMSQNKTSTLKTTPDRSSSSPPISRSSPASERRTTPKLNRSSGSRAIAQAQKFEAMSAGQKQKKETRPVSSRKMSRASSNADSSSEYSRDSQELEEEFKSASKAVYSTSPLPAPFVISASSKLKVLPLKRAETQKTPRPTLSDQVPRPRTPPRQRAMTDPRDPAIFGARTQEETDTREPIRRPSRAADVSNARRSTSRSSLQASNQSPRPPLQRRGTAIDRTGSPRPPTQQRGTAASSQRTPVQANRAATRTSLASTMTTGRGNRAMTSRVSGSGERGRGRSATIQSPVQVSGRPAVGRKTTSALFREIDELVSQDTFTKEA